MADSGDEKTYNRKAACKCIVNNIQMISEQELFNGSRKKWALRRRRRLMLITIVDLLWSNLPISDKTSSVISLVRSITSLKIFLYKCHFLWVVLKADERYFLEVFFIIDNEKVRTAAAFFSQILQRIKKCLFNTLAISI